MGELQPLILEIKRHALEDGPGIRTTVFFKGCNLHCPWCHNPDAIDPAPELAFYPRDCIACGDCVGVCPKDALRLEAALLIDRQACNRCGDCAGVCPSQALRLLGRHYEIDELLEIVLRDRKFYEVSGGGVTLSGGEPTLFIDYVAAVLSRLKELGLHTAIQTNGIFVWREFKEKLLPRVDLIMLDVKLASGEKHREYTGRDNAVVWANLGALLRENPGAVLPRIPLIPGFTATRENLTALSRRFRELGVKQFSLLPYNPTWVHKAASLGKSVDPRLSSHLMTAEELAACREIFAWVDTP
ncbi:MAG: glycyl-radical enzyme activating protein [Deltaproteobacteria bacterium]|nr:glycyl-radical enzyme activating protein [Deltaproteobacteria bacterium]